MEQAKAAALQVIDGLYDGEAFNVIDYSDSIASFAPAPVVKDKRNAKQARHYIGQLSAAGGTNIHDTLLEALRPKPIEDMLPIVLFLTDGLPTIGVRSDDQIRMTNHRFAKRSSKPRAKQRSGPISDQIRCAPSLEKINPTHTFGSPQTFPRSVTFDKSRT